MKKEEKPIKNIPPDQRYFYTKEWQKEEAEADKDIAEGRMVGPFETVEEMLPRHHCLEQPSLLGPHWIELGEALPVDDATPAQEVQLVDRLTFCFYLRQGFQVAGVGLSRHLSVAPKVRHAFAHG